MRLAHQTITEQQELILRLHELVGALKQRVTELQAQLTSSSPSGAIGDTLTTTDVEHATAVATDLQRRLGALREEHADVCARADTLHAQKIVAEAERDALRSSVEALRAEVAQQSCEIDQLKAEQLMWRSERALLQLSESSSRRLAGEANTLRSQLDQVALEKRRWRALVSAVASQLDAPLQAQVSTYADRMLRQEEEEEEGKHAMRGVLPPHPPTSSVHSTATASIRAGPRVSLSSVAQPADTVPSVAAPVDVTAVWSRQRRKSGGNGGPPVVSGAAPAAHPRRTDRESGTSLQCATSTQRRQRFLVPQ